LKNLKFITIYLIMEFNRDNILNRSTTAKKAVVMD